MKKLVWVALLAMMGLTGFRAQAQTICPEGYSVVDTMLNGSSNNSNTPFGSSYYYHVTWSIYSRQELEAIGITPGSQLREIGYSLYSPNGHTVYNVEIYFKEVPLQAITAEADSVPLSEMTLVCSAAQVDFVHGWNYLTLDSTFTYTGYGHLMVAVKRVGTALNVTTNTRNFTVMAGKTVRRFRSTQNSATTASALYGMRAAIAFRTCTPPWDCTAPTIASLHSEGNSVQVVIVGGAAERQVALVPAGGNPDDSTALWVNATGDTVLIDSLDTWTTYDVYARSLCNGCPSLWSEAQQVKTHCGVQTLPYTKYLSAENTDSCWVRHNVEVFGDYFISDDSTSYSYAVLPAMDRPLNQLHIQFRYTLQAGRRMVLGVMTDAYDTTTFVPYDTLTAEQHCNNAVYDFDLNRWTGPEGRLAFRWTAGRIRWVQVDTVFGCNTPTFLTVSDVTGTSARLAWRNRSTTVTGYEVGLAEGTQYLNPTIFSTDSVGMVLDSLQPGTYYSVQVRTRCGENNTVGPNGVSQWSGWKQFCTECVTVSALPYRLTNGELGLAEGTNFAAPCWEYVPDVYGFSYWVLPEFDTNSIRMDQLKITLSLHYNSDAPDVIGLGVVDNDTTLASNFAQIGQINMPGFDNYNVSTGKRVFYCNLRQGKRLAFRMLGNKIQTIDSIVVEQVACPPVRDIVLTASTDTSMTLNWTEQGTATQWLVSLTSQDSTYQQTFTVTAKPFTVGGLTAYTKYNVEVRALNNGDTGEVCQKWLRTAPDALHTFVQVSVGGNPSTASGSFNYPVYRASAHSWQQMLYPLSTQGKAGWIDTVWFYCISRYPLSETLDTSLTLYLGHADTTVARTTHDWVPMDGLTQVYHTDNWRAPATGWVPIALDTPFLYNGTDELAVVFSHSSPYTRNNGDQYAYRSMSNGVTMHRDGNNAVFASHPGSTVGTRESTLPVARFSMLAHTCTPVAYVAATRLGIDTVQIAWIERGTASQWQVECSDDSTWLSDTLVSGTPQLTLVGLALDHTYRFRVRPVCAAGDTGYYSGYVTLDLNTPPPAVDTLTLTSTTLSAHPEVPIDVTYADYGFLVEFIYPANLLAGMEGSIIHGVQFHANNQSKVFDETFTLAMQEVADSTCTIAAWRHDSTALQVWTGSVVVEDSLWTVWFDTPFTYAGGHLLFRTATDGLTGGGWGGNGFLCFSTGDTVGRYQRANAQHQLQPNLCFTTPYLPAVDFFYNLAGGFCHRPQHVVADSVWGTGATMSWDSMPEAIGYQWTLTNGLQTVDSGITTVTTVSVGGLTIFDTYTFAVSTLCDSGDVSGATMVTFTAQNPIDCNGTLPPYFEDFESVTAEDWNSANGNLPDCWSSIAIGASHRPKVVSSYQYMTTFGSQALLIMAGNYSGYADAAYVMLPVFSDSLQRLSVAFDYRCESANYGALTVGYWNDSLLTFHPVRNLASHTGLLYARDTVSFADVASVPHPTHTHIALKWYCNTSYYGVAVDNLEVFINNGIPAPVPLTVDSVGVQCASFSWSAVAGATAYLVSVEGVGDTVVSGTSVTFCGLNQESDYSVKVAALVGTDTGLYTPSIPFSTQAYCASLADVALNADGVVTWQYATGGVLPPTGVQIVITDTATGAVVVTDTVYGNSYTPSSLYPYHTYSIVVTTLCGSVLANSSAPIVVTLPPAVCYEVRGPHSESYRFINGYSRYNYNQMLYPASMVGTVDTLYGIAFRVSEGNPYQYRNVDIYLGHTSATSLSSPVSATGFTQVADNYQYSIADTGWSRILFDTPFVYDGASNLIVTMVDVSGFDAPFEPGTGMHAPQAGESFLYYTAIYSSHPTPDPYTLNFTAYSYSWIPDIQLLGGCDYNQCLSPWVSVAGTTPHSVTLAWQQRGQEDLWQVEYRADSGEPWTVAGTTTAITYTLAGLPTGSSYQVRVASLCGGDTLYSDNLNVSTDCDTVSLPYHTDFTLGYYPCWNVNANTWETFPGIRLSPGYSNDYKAISPAVNVPMSDVKVTIRALNPYDDSQYYSYDASYAVGVCDSNGANTVWIDTVPIVQRHVLEERTVFLHNYSGSQRHVIVRPVYNTSEVHSITLDVISGCLPVQEVWVTELTDTSATLQWEPEDATNTFAVYLDGALLGIATGTSWPLSSLTPSTQHNASVREICGVGDTAMAIGCLFHTACAATSLPYFEGFGNSAYQEDIVGIPDCWTLHHNIATDYQTVYYDPELHLYSSPYTDSSVANFLCSPLLRVGSHGGIVRFKGKAGFAGVAGNVKVGVMTNISDTASFIPIVTVTPSYGNSPLQWYEFCTDSLSLPDVWAVAFRWTGGSQGAFDSLSVTANPVTTYTVTLGVNDTAMGSVSGAGTYEEGSVVIVTATPNLGYRFVVWSDSVTSATRQITLRDNDISLTAYFEPVPQYTVTVTAVMNEGGHYDGLADMVHGAGTYEDGDTVTLEGEVHGCGISLVFWITAEGDTLYDNPYTFVIHSDVTLTAVFAQFGGIDDLRTPNTDFRIYPNPASTMVTIETDRPATMTLMDVSGREIGKWRVEGGTTTIDISKLPKGVYFVRLDGSGAVRKLIVK